MKIKCNICLTRRNGQLDFDLWFDEDNFFGYLKASDNCQKVAIGNDQTNFIECINSYDKFWYIVYEHETIKDSAANNYPATRFRTHYIKDNNEWDPKKPCNELSSCSRMKLAVKFTHMYIIELNKVNYKYVLSEFKQGKQPNGDARKPKFKINKSNIDNFIVYRYTFTNNSPFVSPFDNQ